MSTEQNNKVIQCCDDDDDGNNIIRARVCVSCFRELPIQTDTEVLLAFDG